MKNIAVFTVLVIIFFTITVNNSAHCQQHFLSNMGDEGKERKYNLSFGTQFGFVYGQALELVYPVSGETKGELLSELKWDMKPVFYYGIQLDFSRIDLMGAPGFFAEVSFKAGVPADTGVMEDRDWQSYENGALTNFSSSTNNTGEFYWLDAAIGASFPVRSFFYLKPFFSGSWMRFSFSSRNGYYKYARGKDSYNNPTKFFPINDNPDEGTLSGNVISYQQDWFLIAAGISIGTKLLHPFSFELSFQISPLTYCASTDDHILREIVFKDFTSFGLFLEPKGSFSFNFERLEFSLEYTYRYIGRTSGESYKSYYFMSEDYYLSPEKAGAAMAVKNLSFIIKLKLYGNTTAIKTAVKHKSGKS